MIRRLVPLLLALLLSGVARPALSEPGAPVLTAAEAQRDLRILKRALTELHPGLYRHQTPADVDAAFAAAAEEVRDGADRGRMYLLASRLAAAVRCGHTWTNTLNQGEALKREVFARADKLPVTVRYVAGRLLVTGSATAGVDRGMELVAVDGRRASDLAATMLPYLRADAGADATRLSQLTHDEDGGALDRLLPLLFPPVDGGYRLQVRDTAGPRELRVAATSVAARTAALAAAGLGEPPMDWKVEIRGDVAVFTMPTMAFWDGKFDWRASLASTFATLESRKVRYLIIDQRQNVGGDDTIGKEILQRLLRQPYTPPATRSESAYERVPYVLGRYLDTWDFSFFDRTGQVTRGSGRNWILKDQPPPTTLQPAAQPFRGRTIALVGPRNSSAGYLFARDLKASGAATLVGQATGGTQRGLNGGQLTWLMLPASGVAVDIPLISGLHEGAPDAGVEPDVAVAPSFEDAQAGIDTEMRAATALVQRWRQEARRR